MTLIMKNFNADKPDLSIQAHLTELANQYRKEDIFEQCLLEIENDYIDAWKSDTLNYLNEVVSVHAFSPEEFADDTANRDSLENLLSWMIGQQFDWRRRSDEIARSIKNAKEFINIKNVVVNGLSDLKLDALVKVNDRKVGVEVEGSTNIEKGLFALRMAKRKGQTDYGVLIVPLWPLGKGRACQVKAQARLDAEFSGSQQTADGPIYALTPIRLLDVCQHALDR